MREILFRGKNKETDIWEYGSYDCIDGRSYIMFMSMFDSVIGPTYFPTSIDVKTETVGEYTGLRSKNGEYIFEDDIIKDVSTGELFEIIYEGHQFIRKDNQGFYYYTFDPDEYEIVGNIHDNPKMLNQYNF